MTLALLILLADAIYGRPGLVKPCDDMAYLTIEIVMPPPMAAMLFVGPPPPPALMPLPRVTTTNMWLRERRAQYQADLVRRAIVHRAGIERQAQGRKPEPVVVPIDALPLLP